MTEQLRQALAALRFNSAETPDDVWHTSPSHVDGLHTRAEHRIRTGVLDAKNSTGPSPIGLSLQGQKGVGKTHLLGGVRQVVQREGGYFFLIDLTTGDAFWEDVVEAMRSELLRRSDDGELQLTNLLERLCKEARVPNPEAILGKEPLTINELHGFVGAIRQLDARVAVECGDTIRALVLYASLDSELADIGMDYLAGREADAKKWRSWGLYPEPKHQRALVTEISRVLALTGPSVVAIDQLDSLIDRSGVGGELAMIAGGLMQLREVTRRTLSIVACLPTTWKRLHEVATDTVADRFTETPILGSIADPRLGATLAAKWLGVIYDGIGFTPPHPTWPVATSAFGDAWTPFTPRQLLRRIQEHAEACMYGEIRELTSFDEPIEQPPDTVPDTSPGEDPPYFAEFDRRFAELRAQADVDGALSHHTENAIMPDLLQAGLRSWITEIGNDDRSWETEPPPNGGRQLHAGLRRTLDEELDLAERWLFRAIAPRHGNTVLRLVREAKAAAGIRPGARNRHLVFLRQSQKGWTGAKTKAEINDLDRLEITKDDVRTFHALKEMLARQSYELLNWLVVRKPASQTTFLKNVLPSPTQSTAEHQETRPPPARTADNSTAVATEHSPGASAPAAINHPASTENPTVARTEHPATASSEGLAAGSVGHPADVSSEGPAAVSIERPSAAPTEHPAAASIEHPAVARTEHPATVSSEGPAAASIEQPATASSEDPVPASIGHPAVARTEHPATASEDPAAASVGHPAAVSSADPAASSTGFPATQLTNHPTHLTNHPTHLTSEIVLGMDGEIRIALESLRKHAVVFAGSGTGKTVLLRRIVEECALRGVSAIVLDPNNDLARLGDAWPAPPDGWRAGDAESAAEYLANTEVVVWTPGRAAGRPLSFHPLPDFAGVRDDADEFSAAVGAAVAALVPHARVVGGAKHAVRGRAVLREALTHFARQDGRSLSAFVDMLAELPVGVSKLSTATKMAADLAETLRAAMVNDPLLGGAGEPADPDVLLTPSPGKRARISVINFVGLPGDEQKQGFISQLQLEVFAWIKRNPATDRPLGGLLVMDEAQTIAPSGAWTASTQSTIMLASQARKYGLGLLLATQAPKGLHNQVTGNATTQFFGRLNSPAQIAAANEMARAKGADVGDISRLERGQFYVTGETFGFRRMRAPLCLSHHPPGPLRLEEVLDRARR